MSSEPDPTRWAEPGAGGPNRISELLSEGRRDLPELYELQSLAARLGPILSAPQGASPADGEVPNPANTTADLSSGLGGSLGTTPAVIGALATGGLLLIGGLWWALPGTPGNPPLPSVAMPSSAFRAPNQALLAPSAVRADRADESPDPPDPPPELPAAKSQSPAIPHSAPRVPPDPGRRVPRAPSETAILEQARASLAQDPERALALTREHQRLFPGGALVQEREVIAIHALERLNRKKEAQRRAQGFGSSFPDSPHQPITGEPTRSSPSNNSNSGSKPLNPRRTP